MGSAADAACARRPAACPASPGRPAGRHRRQRSPHPRRTNMKTTVSSSIVPRSLRRVLTLAAAGAVVPLAAACSDDGPVEPDPRDEAVATLRRATDRYHDVKAALADGFVFLHGCENRPGEGPVGTVYVHPERLMDGKIDPAAPEALIYEPRGTGAPVLVGV